MPTEPTNLRRGQVLISKNFNLNNNCASILMAIFHASRKSDFIGSTIAQITKTEGWEMGARELLRA